MPVVRSDVQRQTVASLSARIVDHLRGAGDRHRPPRRVLRVEVISLVGEQAGQRSGLAKTVSRMRTTRCPASRRRRGTRTSEDSGTPWINLPAVTRSSRASASREGSATSRSRGRLIGSLPGCLTDKPSACAPSLAGGEQHTWPRSAHQPRTAPAWSASSVRSTPSSRPMRSTSSRSTVCRATDQASPRPAASARACRSSAAVRRNRGARPSLIHRLPCLPTHTRPTQLRNRMKSRFPAAGPPPDAAGPAPTRKRGHWLHRLPVAKIGN